MNMFCTDELEVILFVFAIDMLPVCSFSDVDASKKIILILDKSDF